MANQPGDGDELVRRRRRNNLVVALLLAIFVIAIFTWVIVRMGATGQP